MIFAGLDESQKSSTQGAAERPKIAPPVGPAGLEDHFLSGKEKNRFFCGFHGVLCQVLRGAGGVHSQLHVGHGVQAHHGAEALWILSGVDGRQLEGGGPGEVHAEENFFPLQALHQDVQGRFQLAPLHAKGEIQEVHRLGHADDHFQVGADALGVAAVADDDDLCHSLTRRTP